MLTGKLLQVLDRMEWIAPINYLLTEGNVPWADIDDAIATGDIAVAGSKGPDGSVGIESLVYDPRYIMKVEAEAEFAQQREYAGCERGNRPPSQLERHVMARARLR